VRFLFGFPFALVFLTLVLAATHTALPHPHGDFWFWIVAGALSQIIGTALMLMTMEQRSFVIATAYIKTEPLFVAILGLVFLHDVLTVPMIAAILIATAGVIVISLKPKGGYGNWHTALLGLGSGGMFAISAIGFRGAILSLHMPGYVLPATFTLAVGLAIQAATLTIWLAWHTPRVLRAMMHLWRPSLTAGLTGAFASDLWFLAFALAPAASVRTLGLVDVIFAQIVSHYLFGHRTTRREYAGMAVLLSGAILLVAVHQ
jgi:drug/metabolite transporter (DMT)-like permease